MPFSEHDTNSIVKNLREAALTEILPRFQKIPASEIRTKSSVLDLVTDADEAAERRITSALQGVFSGAVIVGEEASEKDPQLLHRIATAELTILVDPIDGTKNFASGLPLFGVMASVVQNGQVIAGVIYDPISDDWAIGLKGEGAWIQRDGAKRTYLKVGQAPATEDLLGVASWMFLAEPLRSSVLRGLPVLAGAADYRCTAHHYRLIASGHYDFALFSKLMPWDHAAGWLIHHEAGGYSAKFDGTPYLPSDVTGGLLCTPDESSWRRLHSILFPNQVL